MPNVNCPRSSRAGQRPSQPSEGRSARSAHGSSASSATHVPNQLRRESLPVRAARQQTTLDNQQCTGTSGGECSDRCFSYSQRGLWLPAGVLHASATSGSSPLATACAPGYIKANISGGVYAASLPALSKNCRRASSGDPDSEGNFCIIAALLKLKAYRNRHVRTPFLGQFRKRSQKPCVLHGSSLAP